MISAMETLSIVHITPRYFPFIGGMEYVVKSLAEEMSKIGHDVTVFTLDSTGVLPRKETVNKVSVQRFFGFSVHNAYHFPGLKFLASLLRKNPDVVHVHNIHALTSFLAWIERKTKRKVRVILTPYYHGSGHRKARNFLWLIYRHVAAKIVWSADVLHTVSTLEAKLVQRHFNRQPVIVENGVNGDIRTVTWNPEKGRILYAGRVEKYKGVQFIAKLVKSLRERWIPEAKFVIVGEGSYKKSLLNLVEKMKLPYESYPFLPREKYLSQVSRAHALALFSERESYPQSVNEAQAIGVPVLITGQWITAFRHRPRTLVVDLALSDQKLAERVAWFLEEEASRQPKAQVPLWREVIERRYMDMYRGHLN
jgi:glycosyltransferase involved in cell wall biosynthesis